MLTDTNGIAHAGTSVGAQGRRTTVRTSKSVRGQIESIRVLGREEPSLADYARDVYLISLLQGKTRLRDPQYPFIEHLWFRSETPTAEPSLHKAQKLPYSINGRQLNQSQADVVEGMVAPRPPIVVAQGEPTVCITRVSLMSYSSGPPGTGKTTTISVAMRELTALGRSAYVVAQSNVGVKNIAESMCKHGVNFKLIVSREFYVEW